MTDNGNKRYVYWVSYVIKDIGPSAGDISLLKPISSADQVLLIQAEITDYLNLGPVIVLSWTLLKIEDA
jgi:hypothetical protein